TTTLVAEMLEASKQPVKLAGNIGIVATEVAQTLENEDMLLLELSSFQLMGVHTFKPHIAALLNLYEAHIDYHGTIEAYEKAKINVFTKQTASDFLVYNADDSRVVKAIEQSKAQLIPFSTTRKHPQGAWMEDGIIYFKEEKIIETK